MSQGSRDSRRNSLPNDPSVSDSMVRHLAACTDESSATLPLAFPVDEAKDDYQRAMDFCERLLGSGTIPAWHRGIDSVSGCWRFIASGVTRLHLPAMWPEQRPTRSALFELFEELAASPAGSTSRNGLLSRAARKPGWSGPGSASRRPKARMHASKPP